MPVDKAMADSILGTFRKMFQELEDKGAEGESFQVMRETMDRMEKLALETYDVSEFTAKLTTENLFMDFSNAYTETMTALVKGEYSGDGGDELLMEKTIEAYEHAIENLKGNPHYEKLKAPLEELIEVGKSGVSYPVFLRIAEEQGLNQTLQGDMVVRDAILSEKLFCEFMHLPLEVEKHEKILKMHDQLASQTPFNVVDSFQFGLERQKIEWKYTPLINRWHIISRLWEKMIENVYDWLDSFGSFAPRDERWMSRRGITYTMHNIKRTQECNPGILKAREKVFMEYFQMSWDDIFDHETFLTAYDAKQIWYSDQTLELIKKAHPYCKPFTKPEPDLIREAEEIYATQSYKRPDAFQYSEEDKEKFIALFGEDKWNEYFGRQ
ncbi:MAG: hypothetical protein QM405_07710 [Euryarchaeota archaeon]|jgi:hypothetical protein|nr:hypothetical protein [Euryarchaeota archaeon]